MNEVTICMPTTVQIVAYFSFTNRIKWYTRTGAYIHINNIKAINLNKRTKLKVLCIIYVFDRIALYRSWSNKRMKEKQYVQSAFYLPFSQSTETGQETSEKEERQQKENENEKKRRERD